MLKRTEDWISVVSPKALLVGENPTLQWSDEVIDHVMFLDYYFREKPRDLGERSRWSEAAATFDYIRDITAERCRPEQLFATDLWLGPLERAPKGKHILIPEREAKLGMQHLRNILRDNPTIETVFVMDMQANYYLQKLGFCSADEEYLHGAQPRNTGLQNDPPFYQPVSGKVFRKICCKRFGIAGYTAELIPILPARDYPLRDDNIRIYGDLYASLIESFRNE